MVWKNKYLLMNVLNEVVEDIIQVLFGMKSFMVMLLVKGGWSFIYMVIFEESFWDIIDLFKVKGVEGIFIIFI